MQPRRFYPLLGFEPPTLVIGNGVVISGSRIAGLNELSAGFGATVPGAYLSYRAGLGAALRNRACDRTGGKRHAAP